MKSIASVITLLALFTAVGAELTQNGSFEAQFKGWDYPHWEKKPRPGRIVNEHVYGGKNAFEMGLAGDQENYIYTRLPVEPGKSYRLTLCLRADNAPKGDLALRMIAFRPNPEQPGKFKTNGYVEVPPGSGIGKLLIDGGTHPWKEFEIRVDSNSIPAGTAYLNLLLTRKNNGQGIIAVDEVSWKEIPEQENAPPGAGAQAAVNLWPGDSSFETSSWPLPLPRKKLRAAHGEYLLCLPPEKKEFEFHYLFNVMKPATRGTLSFSARSDAPATLTVKFYNEFYRGIGSRTVAIDAEWRRFSLPLNPNPGRSVALTFLRTGSAEIQLDAFSFASGDTAPANYLPDPVSVGIVESGEPQEVYYTGKEAVHRLVALRNNQKQAARIKLSLQLKTPGETAPTPLLERTIDLAPEARFEESVQVLPERLQGYYQLILTAECDGRKIRRDSPFIITDRPQPITDKSMFGLHQGNYEAFRRIGMANVRHFRNWSFWPMRDGKYVTDYDGPSYFNLRQPRTDYGIRHMETLFIAHIPPRLKQPGKPHAPYEEMERFVDAIVNGTRGISNWFEIENEPHLAFPSVFGTDLPHAAGIYAEMTKKLARRIRQLNPQAKILGAGAGIRTEEQIDFICSVMRAAGDSIDVLSIHPYVPSRYINAEYSDMGPDDLQMYARTLRLRNRCRELGYAPEIWYGEVGWALDIREDCLSPAAMRHAAYVARLMLIAKAADVKKVFYFLGDAHIEKENFYYGLWRVGRPLPAALAYAASAQLLEGAATDEAISDTDIKRFTYRDRNGKLFAAIWLPGNRRAKCTVDLPPEAVEVRNLFNQTVPVKGEKTLTLDVGGEPVYLFAGDIPEAAFKKAVAQAKFDLPPLRSAWRILARDKVAVTLTNLRGQPFHGTLRLEGGGLASQQKFQLEADGSREFIFQLREAEGKRRLHLSGTGNLGDFSSEYQLDLTSCPKYAQKPEKPLPAVGRLPVMNDRTWLLPNDPDNGWDGPQNLSVESAISYDDANLYLAINARDDNPVQNRNPGDLWREDAVQLAIDTQADACPGVFVYDENDYEFGFALSSSGPQKELTHLYEIGRKAKALEEVSLTAFRNGDRTCYRIAIPWKTLKMKPVKGTVFALNFIVNDNDGNGSRFYMGLTPGIVEAKNPYAFRKFILE